MKVVIAMTVVMMMMIIKSNYNHDSYDNQSANRKMWTNNHFGYVLIVIFLLSLRESQRFKQTEIIQECVLV